MSQLFLVVTNILSDFTLLLPDGDKGLFGTQTKVTIKYFSCPSQERCQKNVIFSVIVTKGES